MTKFEQFEQMLTEHGGMLQTTHVTAEGILTHGERIHYPQGFPKGYGLSGGLEDGRCSQGMRMNWGK